MSNLNDLVCEPPLSRIVMNWRGIFVDAFPLPFSLSLSYVSHTFLRWRNARNSPKPYDLNEFPSFESFGWKGEAYSYRALLDIHVRSKRSCRFGSLVFAHNSSIEPLDDSQSTQRPSQHRPSVQRKIFPLPPLPRAFFRLAYCHLWEFKT